MAAKHKNHVTGKFESLSSSTGVLGSQENSHPHKAIQGYLAHNVRGF
jgi:hypothetical protein